MGQRPTHRSESQDVTPAEAGVHVWEKMHSRSPAFAEDELRGNDVTSEGVRRPRTKNPCSFFARPVRQLTDELYLVFLAWPLPFWYAHAEFLSLQRMRAECHLFTLEIGAKTYEYERHK
jgi:hypothetical protein